MYDVQQADPADVFAPFERLWLINPASEKSSMAARRKSRKVRRASFLAALLAIHGAGNKLPVNLVFVAEEKRKSVSPHFPQLCGAGGDGGSGKLSWNFHAQRFAGTRRRSPHDVGRKGSHRVRTDFQRRTLAARPASDLTLATKRGWTARVAPRRSARHARLARWQ